MSSAKDGRRPLGGAGERLAAAYLERRGYRIVARNVHLPGGELDLVARDGACLVFIEVRLRRRGGPAAALESIGPAKRARLRDLVARYCSNLGEPPEDVRIDVVAIALDQQGRPREVILIKNAVEGE